ncbi:MAG: flagellar basal body rod protein FlgC [Pirellulaceae bacterium]
MPVDASNQFPGIPLGGFHVWRPFSVTNISASGMSAERLRMEIVANNIANANSTRTADGGPFRRMVPIFSAEGTDGLGRLDESNEMHGVKVTRVEFDDSEFPMVHIPGHPDADAEGMVRMPNVKLPNEMVDLILRVGRTKPT